MLQTAGKADRISDFSKVEELGSGDRACFEELREVLVRHNALNRFGVTLLHSHFAVADDEILKEYRDEVNRVLTLKPVKKGSLEGQDLVYTAWDLETGQPIIGCIRWDD